MWSVYILQAVAILLRSEKSSGGSYFDNVKRDNVNYSAKNSDVFVKDAQKIMPSSFIVTEQIGTKFDIIK